MSTPNNMGNTSSAKVVPSQGSQLAADTDRTCWICFDDSETLSDLIRPCKCPHWVHRKCLAQWQERQRGKPEENTCRFCNQRLPEWQNASKSTRIAPAPQLPPPRSYVSPERVSASPSAPPLPPPPQCIFNFTVREMFRAPSPTVQISLSDPERAEKVKAGIHVRSHPSNIDHLMWEYEIDGLFPKGLGSMNNIKECLDIIYHNSGRPRTLNVTCYIMKKNTKKR